MSALRAPAELLPHREPFLFLDEVLELSDTRIVARRTIRADEPQFRGHYPGKPIMPGVLLCEAVLQAGCYLLIARAASSSEPAASNLTPLVTRMNEVKFKRMVKPGDVITLEVEHQRTMMGAHFLRGTVKLDGKVAASLEFAVALATEPEGSAS